MKTNEQMAQELLPKFRSFERRMGANIVLSVRRPERIVDVKISQREMALNDDHQLATLIKARLDCA